MDYYMEAWQAKWWEKEGLYGTLIWPCAQNLNKYLQSYAGLKLHATKLSNFFLNTTEANTRTTEWILR